MAAKYENLAILLRNEINKITEEGGDRLPTENELSDAYSVSRQTVRHALKLLEDEGTITRRQGSGSYINKPTGPEKMKQVAVITTFIDNYIFPSILHDMQNVFIDHGYSTAIFATDNRESKEREILEGLLENEVDAILLEGSKTAFPTPNADLFETIREKHIPLLFIHGNYSNVTGFPSILDDNFSGGYMIGKYLVKRGCQHVGGIFKFDDMQGPGRYNGLLTALFEAGVDVDESKFCWYGTEERKKVMDDGDDYNGYLKGFLDRMVEEKAIDGLVCYNDEISPYAVRHLISIGARMPEDIKLTSFDNSFYSQIGPLTVTSIGHGKIRMGIEAANMLLEIMEGKEPPSRKIRWELNQRASS